MDTVIFNRTSSLIFAVVFAVSLFGAIIRKIYLEYAFKNKRKPKYLTPLNIFTAGTFISVYLLFVDFGDFRTITDSFKNTLDVFNWLLDFEEIYEFAGKTEFPENGNIPILDRIFISCLYFGTPLLTMRAFFVIFKDKLARLRYYFSFGRDCHIFSALTEKSICLATDICNKSKLRVKPLIIFCNVNAGNVNDGLLLKAECINALCYKKSVLDFKTDKLFQGIIFNKKTEESIYLSSDNDAVNEKDCVYLTQSYKETIDNLYVFSSLESSAYIVNKAKKTETVNYSVHLINEAQMLAYSLLFEHPMYESANNNMNSVLVVGAGKTGLEIAKNSIWCGAMTTLEYRLRIIDKNDKMKELKAKYGDFKKDAEDAGVNIDCDCIRKNVDSDGLEDTVRDNADATYIVVALGNDELTLNTAVLLRKLYRRISVSKASDYSPKIIPILKSNNYKKIADSAKEFDLTPFGFYENIYSCDTVNNWKIEKIARELNKKYNKAAKYKVTDNYYDLDEIDQLSNRAVAVHSKYKVFDAGYSVVKEENGNYMLSEREGSPFPSADKQQENEHNRWVLFMILNGWKTMPLSIVKSRKMNNEDPPQKDFKTETHACIVTNEKLYELGMIIGNDSSKYTAYDRVIVENTPKCLVEILNAEAHSKE